VSWLDPVTAAWLGEAIEIICPPLLLFGLATRFAALPMLLLSLVIQFSYQALDQHLFWAILFGWFVVKGAGPISLDALIGRGIAATALPLAGGSLVSSGPCRAGAILPSSCSCVAGSRPCSSGRAS
jgi:DoxX